jgi:hypothetical protein
VKNTVGEISFGEADSRSETPTPIRSGPPLGFVKTGRVGLGSAILGRAERKQRREPAGPLGPS